MAPIHPGEILREEFLLPLGLGADELANGLNVLLHVVEEIINENRPIAADMALRLARYFGTTDLFWMNLQTRYDLERERDRFGDRLEREVAVYKSAG